MPTARKLEWIGSNQRLEASALGLEVFYRVEGEPGNWTLISPGLREYVRTPGYETQSAAKAAAQVDFERRITAELAQEQPGPVVVMTGEKVDLSAHFNLVRKIVEEIVGQPTAREITQ